MQIPGKYDRILNYLLEQFKENRLSFLNIGVLESEDHEKYFVTSEGDYPEGPMVDTTLWVEKEFEEIKNEVAEYVEAVKDYYRRKPIAIQEMMKNTQDWNVAQNHVLKECCQKEMFDTDEGSEAVDYVFKNIGDSIDVVYLVHAPVPEDFQGCIHNHTIVTNDLVNYSVIELP